MLFSAKLGSGFTTKSASRCLTDWLRFEAYKNKLGSTSAEGRIYYAGPLRRVTSLPRIKLDLTVDEVMCSALRPRIDARRTRCCSATSKSYRYD